MKELKRYYGGKTSSYAGETNVSGVYYNRTSGDPSFTCENLSPKQFLEKYSLPRIVNIVPEEPVAGADTGNPVSLLNGKLLIYRQYKGGKIEAKTFCKSRSSDKHNSVYETQHSPGNENSIIVIPDTYEGWFSVVTERGQVKARLYTSIQRLITAQVTAFLVLTPDLVGYIQNHRKNADGMRNQYCKVTVKSGQVLKLLAVYQDIASQSARSKRLSWPLLGMKQENTQYAQCLTPAKQIVYIPLTTHGHFYSVATVNNTPEDNVSKVYQIAKLLQIFPLPVRVCTIAPNKSQGSMLLESYHKEDVMLACILESNQGGGWQQQHQHNKFRFLEIDVNSKFYINRVPDEHRQFQSPCIQEALRYCHDNSDRWCQQLKVIHHIYPEKYTNPPAPPTNNSSSNQPSASETNENNNHCKPSSSKKQRKISLGDKKTVKSSSFRYSTSYGPEQRARPLYRNLAAAATEGIVPCHDSHAKAPLYLNVATTKPDENNCSSLPVQQKTHGNTQNQTVEAAASLTSENVSMVSFDATQEARRRPAVSGSSNINNNKNNNSNNDNINNNPIKRLEELTRSSGNHHLVAAGHGHNLSKHQNAAVACGWNSRRNASNTYTEGAADVITRMVEVMNVRSESGNSRNNHLKKNTHNGNIDSSNTNAVLHCEKRKNSGYPPYKTCVKIRLDGAYSSTIDSLEYSSTGQENIYAEIKDPRESEEYYSLEYPFKKSYSVNANECKTPYKFMRPISSTKVNVV